MGVKPEKKGERAVCWRCKTPFDFNVRDVLGLHTLRCMMEGIRRKRYLQYCKKCSLIPIGKIFEEEMSNYKAHLDRLEQAIDKVYAGVDLPANLEPSERNWKLLKRKHMFLMGGRCQVCDIRDDTVDIYVKTTRREGQTPLQRDTVALCGVCYSHVGHRLGVNSGLRKENRT